MRDDPDEEDYEDAGGEGDEDGPIQMEADVICPSCGETISITLDPDGGPNQEYVEDCQVCCRPWRVRVSYDPNGSADVSVENAD